MIALLVRRGAEVRSVDLEFRPSLLRYALSKEDAGMVDDLLTAGVRLLQGEEDNEICKLIHRDGPDILNILKIFVKHGFSIPDYCERYHNRNMPAFVNVGYDMLKCLLEHGAPPDQVQEDEESFTPLTYYADYGLVEELELLIQFGANVEAQLDGRSILSHLLAREPINKGQIKTAESLFRAGAAATVEERTKLLNLLKRG